MRPMATVWAKTGFPLRTPTAHSTMGQLALKTANFSGIPVQFDPSSDRQFEPLEHSHVPQRVR